MHNKIIKLYIILFFLLCGCQHNKSHENENNRIEIGTNIDNLSDIKLSQFANGIKYIPLQSKDNIYFSSGCDFDFQDSVILIYKLYSCLLYNYQGELISVIGNKGNGPGEYLFCIKAGFSDHGSIYIQSTLHDLSEYDFEGNFVRKYSGIFKISETSDDGYRNWISVHDSLFFVPVPNSSGQQTNKALIINTKGDILFHWKNYEIFNRGGPGSSFEQKSYLYKFKDKIHFRQYFSDTLFQINEDGSLIPKYIIDLEEYKMPLPVRTGGFGGAEYWNYIFIEDIFETDDILLVKCFFGNRFPAKRLTPLETPGGKSWYTTTNMLGLFQKNSGEFNFCKPENTDNRLNTTGFINDIDNGPRFFPQKMVNDSVMVMAIEAKYLLEHISSDDFIKATAKEPSSRKKLEDLASEVNPLDNPILMFVTFKNKRE